ncbi:aldose epimerase family protein [Levilactobacillus zymae]|uniref:aldose epimerase family protein n=1 Tax=Levilactobacillus zymae TaxID=267363 RepID=UPI0028BBD817|nr:aldose epimerase family protein [Levilactobacillus zymae]MDT6981253.1 aldose epimerase family protein [Levilactobacillus zymae]
MQITQEIAGELHQQKVTKYVLTNQHGTRAAILTWAATLQEFSALEDGQRQQLAVHQDNLAAYDNNTYCLCQALGRVAGRIKGVAFDIDGTTYQIEATEGKNAIHGGPHGFLHINWDATTQEDGDRASVILTHTSTPQDDQYPGNLTTTITYTLDENDRLTITFKGQSDAATLFNPTIHAYFNVTDDQHDLDQQWLTLNADKRLILNNEKIPTGEKAAVAGTGYDFRKPRTIKDGLAQLAQAGGVEYDDAFEVQPGDAPIATVGDTTGHREVQIYSDRNGVVVFTANATDPARAEKRDYNALALEAQNLPDAIHHDNFGDIVLPANQAVTHTIAYQYVRK